MTTFSKTSYALSNLLDKFKCNQCKQILKDACSFEMCDHFFCKSCAIQLVNDCTPCPLCEKVLWKEHIQEIHWVPEVLSTIENIDCIINDKPFKIAEENNRKRSSFTKVKGTDINKLDDVEKTTNIYDTERKELRAPARAARQSVVTGKRKSRGEKSSVAKKTYEGKGAGDKKKTSQSTEKEKKTRPKRVVSERKNIRGETPLHAACVKGDIGRVRELVECGAKVNTRDFAEWTPLHEACNHGYEEIVKLLINNGAYIDATAGEDKDTPLHDAVTNNHIDVVRFLLQRDDAPVDFKNAQGQLPEDLCTTDEMRSLFE